MTDISSAGVCALCTQRRDLLLSHVIPNAVFRRIKQEQGSGQLIHMDDSADAPIVRSQDTWVDRLLCAGCEQIVSEYERYGLELLRGHASRSAMLDHADGVTFRGFDYSRFKLFLTSVLWRRGMKHLPRSSSHRGTAKKPGYRCLRAGRSPHCASGSCFGGWWIAHPRRKTALIKRA